MEKEKSQNISDYDRYKYDYEEYWENPEVNRSYENRAEKTVLGSLLPEAEALPSKDVSWFCDLGAGFGRLFDIYQYRYKNTVLVDYSVENLKKAKKKVKSENVYFVSANAYQLPFKNETIDCLASVRMIHHLEEPEKVIGQIRNVMKSNGFLILEYANKRHFIEVMRAIAGKSKMKPFGIEPYRRGEDLFFNFHPKYIKKALQSGFKIIKSVSVSNLRSGAIKKVVPVGLMLFIDKVFRPIFNLLKFGPSIFILAQKKEHPNQEEKGSLDTINDILQCPYCGSDELIFIKSEVMCKGCDRHYPIVDGIYDFRV